MNYGLSLISYYEVIYDPGTHHRNNPKSYENLLDNKYSRGACSCYFHKKLLQLYDAPHMSRFS